MILGVIRAELYKATKKRRTYVLALFFWLLLPLLMLLFGWLLQTRVAGTFLDDGANIPTILNALASPFGISRNLLVLLGNSSPNLLLITVVLLAALFVGEERSHHTWKEVFSAQPSRLAVLAGKVIAIMLLLGILFLGCYASGLVIGSLGMLFLPTSVGSGWTELAALYLVQWLFSLAAVLFAFLAVWLLRSLPVAIIAIFFLPSLIEGAISFYLGVVGLNRLNQLNIFLEALRLRNLAESLPQYFFSTNLYAPSRQPLSGLAEAFGPEIAGGLAGSPLGGFFGADLTRSAIVLVIYGVLFATLLTWSFTRRDVT